MMSKYKLSENVIGYFFCITALVYAFTTALFSFISKYLDSRIYIMIGLLTCVISYFLLGPEPRILPSKVYIVIIGLILSGIGLAFSLIP